MTYKDRTIEWSSCEIFIKEAVKTLIVLQIIYTIQWFFVLEESAQR